MIGGQPACAYLARGYVETTLFALKFHIASTIVALLVEDFGKNVFQVFERYDVLVVEAHELGIADVESGAVAVSRLHGGVAVASAQTSHGSVGAREACHLYAVARSAARKHRIGELGAYLIEQPCRLRHEIWHGVRQVVDVICAASVYFLNRARKMIGCAQVGDRLEAYSLGSSEMNGIAVAEHLPQTSTYEVDFHAVNEAVVRDMHRLGADAEVAGKSLWNYDFKFRLLIFGSRVAAAASAASSERKG